MLEKTEKSAHGRKVTITMKSVSGTGGGAPDIMELMTDGELKTVVRDGVEGYQIAYDDTEATGFTGSRTIVSCFGEKIATMERKGAVESNLMIETNRKHHCHYGTEFGDMLLGIYTHKIINRMTDSGGELYFKYTIDVNSALLSENEIYLNVELK
ncbi:MAG: DUF1934 domain-containing protein [Huintestinicola sp.]